MTLLRQLRHDLPASVVVFFVALPLCLGIALASGAPLFSGLIAGVLGGVVVGALSRSSLGVSGPAAGLAVIVLTSIEQLGSFEAFLLAVVIGGLMQVALGVLRAGVLGYFFPAAVIQGMLSGIGLIILLKQLPHAVGYDTDPTGDLAYRQVDGGTTFSALADMLAFFDGPVMLVAAVTLAILLSWELVLVKRHRVFQLLPGPLVAVAFGIAYQYMAGQWSDGWALAPEHLVFVPVATSLSELSALFVMPDFSALTNPAIYTIAATIAVVASIETLLCVEATDKMDPLKRVTPANRELVAQGIGNTLSGLIGGLPITQVIVRSSANIQSGARTRASAICHGLLLLVCVAALPRLINLIPLAVLAVILILTGYKLARPALFRRMWQQGAEQFLPFVATVAGVVLTDLLSGVAIGLAVAVVMMLRHGYRNSHFLHIETRDAGSDRLRVTLRLAEEVTFLNKAAIKHELHTLPDGTELVIDQSRCVYINHDVQEIIDDFLRTAAARNIRVRTIEQATPVTAVSTAMRAAA